MNGTQVIVPSDQATQWGVDHGYGWLYFLEQQTGTMISGAIFIVVVLFMICTFLNTRNNRF